jgi:hypothetical protein
VLHFALNTSSSLKRFGKHSLFVPLKAVRTIGGAMRWFTGIVLVVDREDEVLKILRTAMQATDYVVFHHDGKRSIGCAVPAEISH